MKKYFAIAFVLMVILLLVLRKQTEPTAFVSVKTTPTPVQDSKAGLVPAAPPVQPSPSASPAPSNAADASTSAPVKKASLDELRATAKSMLAGGYTAQKAFYAEFERYSSDLVAIGLEPPTADVNFKMGFLSANDAPAIEDARERPERFSTDAFINNDSSESNQKFRYTPEAEKIRLDTYARYCEQGCVVRKDGFELLLAIPIDDQGHADVWLINDKKELKQVVDGTKP